MQRRTLMRNIFTHLIILFFISIPALVYAADAIQGKVDKQSLNPTAITMFLLFVTATLAITYWAAKRTKSTKDKFTQWADWVQSLDRASPANRFLERNELADRSLGLAVGTKQTCVCVGVELL